MTQVDIIAAHPFPEHGLRIWILTEQFHRYGAVAADVGDFSLYIDVIWVFDDAFVGIKAHGHSFANPKPLVLFQTAEKLQAIFGYGLKRQHEFGVPAKRRAVDRAAVFRKMDRVAIIDLGFHRAFRINLVAVGQHRVPRLELIGCGRDSDSGNGE